MAAKASLESPAESFPSLVPIGSHAGNKPLRIKRQVIVVGSTEQCHLRLLSSTISKLHALIVNTPEGVYIRDLASRTKVFVNGQEQRQAVLRHGDELRIGRFTFKFSAAGPLAGNLTPPPVADIELDGQSIGGLEPGYVLLVGRLPGCDIQLKEEAVSTRHAVIFQSAGKRFLRDLGSRTGTYLNGRKIHQEGIELGNQVHIGQSRLSLAAASPPADWQAPVDVEIPTAPAASAEPLPLAAAPVPAAAAEAQVPPPLPLEPIAAPAERVDLDAPQTDSSDVSGESRIEEIAAEALGPIPAQPSMPPERQNAAGADQKAINFEPVPTPESPPAEAPAEEGIDQGESSDRPRRGWRGESWRDASTISSQAQVAGPLADLPAAPQVDLVAPASGIAATAKAAAVEPPAPPAAADEIATPVELPPAVDAAPAEPVLDLAPENLGVAAVEPPAPPVAAEEASAPVELSPPMQAAPADAIFDLAPEQPEVAAGEPPAPPVAAEEASTPVTLSPPMQAVPADAGFDLAPEQPEVAAVEPPAPPVAAEEASTPVTLSPPMQAVPADAGFDLAPEQPEVAAVEPPAPPVTTEDVPSLVELPPPVETAAAEPVFDLAAEEPEVTAGGPPAPPVVNENTSPVEFLPIAEPPLVEPVVDLAPAEPEASAVESPALPALNEVTAPVELPPPAEPAPVEPVVDLVAAQGEITATTNAAVVEPAGAAAVEPPAPAAPVEAVAGSTMAAPALEEAPLPVKKRRGRPPKPKDESTVAKVTRGRAKRVPPPAIAEESIAAVAPAAEVDLSNLEINLSPPAEAAAAPAPPAGADLEANPPVDLSAFSAAVESQSQAAVEGDSPAHAVQGEVVHPAEVPEIFEGIERVAPVDEQPIAGLAIGPGEFPQKAGGLLPELPPGPPAVPDAQPDQHSESSGEPAVAGPLPPPAAPPDEEKVTASAPFQHTTEVNLTAGGFPFTEDSTVHRAAPPGQFAATTEAAAVAPPVPAAPLPPPALAQPFPPLNDQSLSSIGGTAIFAGAAIDLDHFLGGLPLHLAELRPPPPTFGKVTVRLDGKQRVVQPEPAPAPPPPPPKLAPPMVAPPRKPASTAPFANVPLADSADDFLTSDLAPGNSPFGGAAKPVAGKTPNAFDGLAAPPVRETDVFSNFDAVAVNDAAFGGVRLSRADDFVVPDSPEAAARRQQAPEKDFADDEFWNRTDEEEGLPPMGVPRQRPETPLVKAAPAVESLPVDSGGEESRRPPEMPAPAAPPDKKRRSRRVALLMTAMVLSMAAAVGGIWTLVPKGFQITGQVTFLNYAPTPGTTEESEFAAAQRRFLADAATRQHAKEILVQNHAQVGAEAGFLANPADYSRVIDTLTLTPQRRSNSTVVQLTYSQGDGIGDVDRMGALLQSLIQANGPVLASNHKQSLDLQAARAAADAADKKLADINQQLTDLRSVLDQQPPAEELAKAVAAKQAQRQMAADLVKADTAAVALGQAMAGAATQPDDPQLKGENQQLGDLSAELVAARSDQATAAAQARKQLEEAVGKFNDQLAAAAALSDSGSQLKKFVDSARDSQQKARELINNLLVDGEDLEKQLEDTRRDVEDLIDSRQREKWAADPQLQQLQNQLDSAQHGYNANVGQGVSDPRVLDPLQKQIDDCTARIKARRAELGVDPSEVKVEDGLSRVIEALRNKLIKEKLQIDQVLDPLAKQLAELNPAVADLPAAQQDLARQLHDRLQALNDARQRYTDAVGQGPTTPSAKVTDLQKQIDEVKGQIARREAELAKQASQLPAAQQKLADDEQNLQAANKALQEAQMAHAKLVESSDEERRLMDNQSAALAEVAAAQRVRDDQAAQSGALYDLIKPFNENDVTLSEASVDPRWNDSAYAVIALAVFFGLLLVIARLPARKQDVDSPDENPPAQAM